MTDERTKLPTNEQETPQLEKLKDFDRQQHIQRSMDAGLSREEAERHADEDLKDWDEGTRRERP